MHRGILHITPYAMGFCPRGLSSVLHVVPLLHWCSAQVTLTPAATRGDLAALGAAGSSPPRQWKATVEIIRPCGWDRYPVTRGTRRVARVSDK